MEIERRRYTKTYISIAPMIDVVFLLLLFFMLTSHLVQEPAIKINLPASKTALDPGEGLPTITVTRDRIIFWKQRPVDFEQLQQALAEHARTRNTPTLRIKADRDVHVGRLIRVVDAVQLAGIKSFSIVTERGRKDSE